MSRTFKDAKDRMVHSDATETRSSSLAPRPSRLRNWGYCQTCGGFIRRLGKSWEHDGQRPNHPAKPLPFEE